MVLLSGATPMWEWSEAGCHTAASKCNQWCGVVSGGNKDLLDVCNMCCQWHQYKCLGDDDNAEWQANRPNFDASACAGFPFQWPRHPFDFDARLPESLGGKPEVPPEPVRPEFMFPAGPNTKPPFREIDPWDPTTLDVSDFCDPEECAAELEVCDDECMDKFFSQEISWDDFVECAWCCGDNYKLCRKCVVGFRHNCHPSAMDQIGEVLEDIWHSVF